VDRRRFPLPCFADARARCVGNTEVAEAVVIDDELSGFETKSLQFLGGCFDLIDLARTELITN
jgi:hypothetical protein